MSRGDAGKNEYFLGISLFTIQEKILKILRKCIKKVYKA
jgi:hypothetical protein